MRGFRGGLLGAVDRDLALPDMVIQGTGALEAKAGNQLSRRGDVIALPTRRTLGYEFLTADR